MIHTSGSWRCLPGSGVVCLCLKISPRANASAGRAVLLLLLDRGLISLSMNVSPSLRPWTSAAMSLATGPVAGREKAG